MLALGLKTKAIIATSTLVIILMAIMSFLTFSYFEDRFIKTISDQQLTLIATMAEEINHKLKTAHETLIAEAQVAPPDLIDDPDKAQAFLDKMVGLKTIFDNKIFIFSVTGSLVAETPYEPNRRGLDLSFRDYIKQTLAQKVPYISAPYVSTQSHRHPSIMCTVPVFDSQGNIAYILAGGLDLMKENFLGSLSDIRIGQTGYVYLYTTDRTIVIHPDRSRILQRDVPIGSNHLFDKAIEGFEGTEETINSRGIASLSTVKRIPNTNWILVANHPVVEAYAPLIKGKEYFFLATGAGALLVLFLIRLLMQYLTAPMIAFTRHVESMPTREGDARFSKVHTGDEIGALSLAFNHMIDELDKKNQSLHQSEELYRTVVDFASDLAFWRSPQGQMLYISPNAERITGYPDTDFYADPMLIDNIIHPEDRLLCPEMLTPSTQPLLTCEFRIITKAGESRWISHVRRYIFSDAGDFLGIRGSHSDITDRRLAEDKLRYLSLHDALTGVYNRGFFEAEMRRLTVAQQPTGIIVCDIDGLKLINDTLGHDHGDRLLLEAVEAIRGALTPSTFLARIGGDEFVVLLPDTTPQEVQATVERIQQNIMRRNENALPLLLSISLGMAIGVPLQDNIVLLFKQADDNMYREKLQHSQSTRSSLVQSLMKALAIRDFTEEGHPENLQNYIVRLARQTGLPEENLPRLRLFAQFHDIGKVGILDHILFKQGPLTREERLAIQRHAEIGNRIAQVTPELLPIADWILKHHEWWNGDGYPLGLKGEQIPVECRMLAIVDAYDAMINDRPYRKAMPKAAAISELQRCAGTQFDPYLAEQFILLLHNGNSQDNNHQTA